MRTKLPEVISAYIEASNTRDGERLETLFTKDAVVHDEGEEHRGTNAIRKWLAAKARKYSFTLTPIRLSRKENEIDLTAKMTGAFPGSPISARFRFVLDEGKIATLNIRA